jgi:signal peptidase II
MSTTAVKATPKGLLWVLTIGLFVIAIDQVTKWLAVVFLENQDPVEVFGDLLQLTFVRNSGAAFSIGTEYTLLFSIAATGVTIGILVFSRRVTSRFWLVALGGLFGGAVGNLIDRVFQPPGGFQGHVVDFLELPNWPVFNVADMAVVGSAIFMVSLSVFGVEPTENPEDVDASKYPHNTPPTADEATQVSDELDTRSG